MRGVNKVIIVGTLGADPEVKQFPNGGSITTISVATSEQWNDKQTGERREATEWHRITFNNKLAEIAAQYLRKGRQVYVEGSLRTRKYQDQSGQDRFITEIRADQMQMLGGNPAGMGNDTMSNNMGGNWSNNTGNQNNQPNYNQNYNNNQGYNSQGNQSFGNQPMGGQQPTGGQGSYQPNNNFANTQPNQAANPFIQNNPTVTTAPQLDTPKPGVVDDDVPFSAITNTLVNII